MSSSQPHNVQVRVLASAMILRTVIPDNGPSVGLLRLDQQYADFLRVGLHRLSACGHAV
jgi:hypothetical protein